jgi:N-carbamoyl-L-amino-acid hydrolase
VRELAHEMGGSQVATVGAVELHPNLINVIAARAELTVDLRNTDEALLQQAELRLAAFIGHAGGRRRRAASNPVRARLARFEPVRFDAGVCPRRRSKPATAQRARPRQRRT